MFSSLPKRHKGGLIIGVVLLFVALWLPTEQSPAQAPQRQSLKLELSQAEQQSEYTQAKTANSPAEAPTVPTAKTNGTVEPVKAEPVAKELQTTAQSPQQASARPATQASLQEPVAAAPQSASKKVQNTPETNTSESPANTATEKAEPLFLSSYQADQELLLDQRYQLALELEHAADAPAPQQDSFLSLQRLTVKSGDSLARLFSRAGLSAQTLHQIDRLGGEAKRLRKLHPGDKLDFYLNDEQQLQRLSYALSSTETLNIERDGDSFTAVVDSKEFETRHAFSQGYIKSSFWNAGIEANLSQGLIMSLATVFGWDVDFALDIRWGDNFTVIYEELYIDGHYSGTGNILAAEFVNQGEVFRAIRHSDGNYYTPEGNPMRKAFLRAPVNFKYISSSFNPRRLHPVTGKVRAHNGIDYAAKTGTPVVAAGDGRVVKSGYSKYNGNYIFIQHSATYMTKYLHLHKRYVKSGQRVKQGKTIGTVGATGRVTGPHLHYEFLVNGVHKNPRTVKLPKSKALKGEAKQAFLKIAQQQVAELDNTKRVLLAMR